MAYCMKYPNWMRAIWLRETSNENLPVDAAIAIIIICVAAYCAGVYGGIL